MLQETRLRELYQKFITLKTLKLESKEYQALIALCEHCLGIHNTATYIVTHQQITNIIPALEKYQGGQDCYKSLKYFYSLHQVALKSIIKMIDENPDETTAMEATRLAQKGNVVSLKKMAERLKQQQQQYLRLLKLASNKTLKAIFKEASVYTSLEKIEKSEDIRRGTALRNFETALAETLKNCSNVPTFEVVTNIADFREKAGDNKLAENVQAVLTLRDGQPAIVVLDIPSNLHEKQYELMSYNILYNLSVVN